MKLWHRFNAWPALWVAVTALWVAVGGCGGGGGSSGPGPQPTPTTEPTPVGTATPTATPDPLPGPPFDLRGRTLVDGVARAGVIVRVTGSAGSATASEQTTSGAGGVYSFLLGAGTYTVTASLGGRTSTPRTVTVPGGGLTVDNFDLRL